MSTEKKYKNCKLEFWGGIECTINRVQNTYFDQLEIAGLYEREQDLALIESLGIRTLRYPILWEKHQPYERDVIDWTYTERRLKEMEDRGIRPIVGLLHHGSGPAFTNLLDEKFPEKLAAYAGAVAKQFPQLEYFTPINEPLTTARFSGLYGLWYPHSRNDISFAKMMINQVRGIVLAMCEIRKINPAAKLIQTEDLSKTFCTPSLAYQAAFENERRWLTYDLLCGVLKPGDLMWDCFRRLGIKENELLFFRNNPTPPDIQGFNYYVTSERYLDEDFKKYPPHTRGGNELQEYADMEAIRANHGNPWGVKVLLAEAWERYNLPLAITEAHLNASREDQLRWLNEIYNSCCELRNDGINIRAMTFWSLFGAFGWNKLLTEKQMDYEPGAFDLRSPTPRKTAIASFIKALASEGYSSHELLKNKGWWHRPKRFYVNTKSQKEAMDLNAEVRPLLIVTNGDPIAEELVKLCRWRDIEIMLRGTNEPSFLDRKSLAEAVDKINPWGVINTAGQNSSPQVVTGRENLERDIEAELLLNLLCKKRNLKFATFSSGKVFDSRKHSPYTEVDKKCPTCAHGKMRASAEDEILGENPDALIIRPGTLFRPEDRDNFILNILKDLVKQGTFFAPQELFVSPSYVPHLANAALEIFMDEESGIWHLTNQCSLSWKDLALKISRKAGFSSIEVRDIENPGMPTAPSLQETTCLTSVRGNLMPSLDEAIDCFLNECKILPTVSHAAYNGK